MFQSATIYICKRCTYFASFFSEHNSSRSLFLFICVLLPLWTTLTRFFFHSAVFPAVLFTRHGLLSSVVEVIGSSVFCVCVCVISILFVICECLFVVVGLGKDVVLRRLPPAPDFCPAPFIVAGLFGSIRHRAPSTGIWWHVEYILSYLEGFTGCSIHFFLFFCLVLFVFVFFSFHTNSLTRRIHQNCSCSIQRFIVFVLYKYSLPYTVPYHRLGSLIIAICDTFGLSLLFVGTSLPPCSSREESPFFLFSSLLGLPRL